MQALVLGFVALAVGLIGLSWYAGANTQALAKGLRITFGLTSLAIAVLLLARGMPGYALPLAITGIMSLIYATTHATGSGRRSDGQTSRITTETLDMELDHDSGALRGTVLRGEFAGRAIESMVPAELARLWQDCRFADPASAQLVEAYLDRMYETWREDFARAHGDEDGGGSGSGGAMSRAEALAILGLAEGAGEDEIRRAHRELMKRYHPDRGGTDYLAAKINEAKAVLLGEH